MKKLYLIVSILSALCPMMYAGPEAFSGKEMKQVAPPAPPACPNWTGFYIGGFGGYKHSNTDITLDLGGAWNTLPSQFKDALEPRGSEDLDTSGAEVGGLIGYNYQWNNWVLGLEAAGGYLWLRDSNESETSPVTLGQTTSGLPFRSALTTRYLTTVGPRIGYAFCRWLPYVTGGLAVGDIDFEQRLNLEGPEGGSTSETRAGWMVGGGLQYAITDHWSARAQYQYVDLGCVDFNSVFVPEPTFTSHHEACLTEHNASFAIIYKF